MPALLIQFQEGGVHLPELGLWLDPHRPQLGPEKVFISHAHSDHIAPHREVILSGPTSRLIRARLPVTAVETVLSFREPHEFAGPAAYYHLTLLPAGHIFGSAMAYIKAKGTTLLYTGDFKLRPSLSAEPCEPRSADILIMETTYGRPAYRFPPADQVLQGVIRFCREALDNDEIPVLLGYSLGKSQELLRGLAEAGLPLMLHAQIFRLTKIYEQFGQTFPAYQPLDSNAAAGHVILCPPNIARSALIRQLGPVRMAALTGWALDTQCQFRYGAQAAFPLSDHADFPELIELVRRVQPKKIYTLHGFAADFARSLRELGFDAQPLSQDEQLFLPLAETHTIPDLTSTQSPSPALIPAPASTQTEPPQRPPAQAAHPPTVLSPITAKSPQPAAAFASFAATCRLIGDTSKKLEKIACLASYLRPLPTDELGCAATWFAGHPFPPVENRVLKLGWAIIRDALCAVSKMDHAEFGQVYLKHSDLGETASEILSRLTSSEAQLLLSDVNRFFAQIHAARGPTAKLQILVRFLSLCTALEGKYIIKILTGDLRIGLKEGLLEEAVARAFDAPLQKIKNANLLLGNIAETAQLAARRELHHAALVPFRPVKYMLASPEENAAAVWERTTDFAPADPPARQSPPHLHELKPEHPPLWIEDKYDGIRSQLHKIGPRVAIYSRDLKEITNTFSDLAERMSKMPWDAVLDGEIVAIRNEKIRPFAELQRRLGRREPDLFLGAEIPVDFVAFDLLWCNHQTLLDAPLSQRRSQLEPLAAAGLRLSKITPAHSVRQIEEIFATARLNGNEGLVIKDPASLYAPGRRGLAWLKLKKTLATLDCVIVGAEFGHGKRKALLSDYTFAVRDERNGQLKVIGKAYTGLSDAEIAELTQHFLNRAIRQRGRYFEVPPDTVLEIAFDSLQPSDRHPSGLAMRFPRIVRIRRDKSPDQIDTLRAAWRLVQTPTPLA